MERISSGMTFFYKRIFPVVWFGFLAFFVVMVFVGNKSPNGPPMFLLLVPAFLAVIGIVVMKNMMWKLADEVLDAGDSLMVRKGGDQEQISLSNIVNVGYSPWSNSARVTLTLRTPVRFGSEVSLLARQGFLSFGRSPVIDELIRRVDAVREGR
jgi:hypothetical protein